ncbi:alkaline protease [Cystobacter fuscus DSM 2262]|uniref:Alkaline protease n=1 Tax=Cystobacter fuscus (strain ATCC 25194 / DSM 2262 / NBRC 100088 / M29) TaxID=1242864 RepID=S9QTH6_CYSF2|nr:S8 family serine peptidase [Cystobacter fuscus]EPX59963.1 alkaline protease [Cystobacter fuscus DSM 2262]
MRRLVLLGLLGIAGGGCGVEPPPDDVTPQEQPLCPELVVQAKAAPIASSRATGSASSALSSSGDAQPMLVRFRPQKGLRTAAALRGREDRVRSLGARVKRHWPTLDAMALSLTPEAQARLAKDPDVLSIEPDHEVFALGNVSTWTRPMAASSATPRLQGGGIPSEYTQALRMTQANEVWDPNNQGSLQEGAPTGSGRIVCVVDSGMDLQHPELQAVYAGGRDFVDDDDEPEDKDAQGVWGGGHGTHVAGIIAAQPGVHGSVNPNDPTLSPSGVVGASPGARLLVARVLDTEGSGKVSDVISAVEWCVEKKANIISLSLGSSDSSDLEKEAFDKAKAAGLLSFAASGNGGETATEESRVYPAAYDSVIAVGAVDEEAKHPGFSQIGPHLDFVAPGVNIYSTYPRGKAPFANLWIGSTFYVSSALDYVPFEEYEGKLLNCGQGKGLRSCPEATCDGFVAFVERGGEITFADKVRNVRSQGARAVIIGNNDPEDDDSLLFTLNTDANWPPVTAVTTTLVPTFLAQVGQNVRLGIQGSDYAFSTGTSMATPYASAVAALVWSARPDLKSDQVLEILQKSARYIPNPAQPSKTDQNDVFGYGLVQARAAVDRALAYPSSP